MKLRNYCLFMTFLFINSQVFCQNSVCQDTVVVQSGYAYHIFMAIPHESPVTLHGFSPTDITGKLDYSCKDSLISSFYSHVDYLAEPLEVASPQYYINTIGRQEFKKKSLQYYHELEEIENELWESEYSTIVPLQEGGKIEIRANCLEGEFWRTSTFYGHSTMDVPLREIQRHTSVNYILLHLKGTTKIERLEVDCLGGA